MGDAYTYTPTTKTVTASGTHFCASVAEAGTYFCPGLAVPNWASATTDTGSTACGIVNQITQVQEEVAPDQGARPHLRRTQTWIARPQPRAQHLHSRHSGFLALVAWCSCCSYHKLCCLHLCTAFIRTRHSQEHFTHDIHTNFHYTTIIQHQEYFLDS